MDRNILTFVMTGEDLTRSSDTRIFGFHHFFPLWVVIARAAMSRPRVLLMDEPTRGVDVGAKAEILESMHRLAADGLAVVFASSDLAEVRGGATRILVMSRGRLTADVAAADATDEALASAASAMPDSDDGGLRARA